MGIVLLFLLGSSVVTALRLFVFEPNVQTGLLGQGTSIRTDGQYLRAVAPDCGLNLSMVYMLHTDDLDRYQHYLEDWTTVHCNRGTEQGDCLTKNWKHPALPEWTKPGYPCEAYLPGSCPLSGQSCMLWGNKGCKTLKETWQ